MTNTDTEADRLTAAIHAAWANEQSMIDGGQAVAGRCDCLRAERALALHYGDDASAAALAAEIAFWRHSVSGGTL